MNYLSSFSNELCKLIRETARIVYRSRNERDSKSLCRIRIAISDVQVSKFDVYELADTHFNVLFALRRVIVVPDLDLSSTYIEPLPAFRSAVQLAFRLQQRQAIRYVAQFAGKRAAGAAWLQLFSLQVGTISRPQGEEGGRSRGQGRCHVRGGWQ